MPFDPGYLVLGLPRSRTFWLSRLLQCEHDLLGRCSDVDEFWRTLAGGGAVDTTAVALAHEAARRGVRMAVVWRPLGEVLESLTALDLPGWDPARAETLFTAFEEALLGLDVPTFMWSDLSNESVARELWRVVRPGEAFPEGRYNAIVDRNLQTDVRAQIRGANRALVDDMAQRVLRMHGDVPCESPPRTLSSTTSSPQRTSARPARTTTSLAGS